MYELEYDKNGLPDGAIRITERDTVTRWRKFIQDLYRAGEEVETFFEREVAGLEPPRGA
jgi:hypothetical protein